MALNDTMMTWTPYDAENNTAEIVVRNYTPVLAFDDTTSETAYFRGVIPQQYNGNGLLINFWYCSVNASYGDANITWSAANLKGSSISWYSPGSADLGVNTSAGSTVCRAWAYVYNGSLTFKPGDMILLKITRNPGDSGDQLTGDWQLIGVELRECSSYDPSQDGE